MLDIIKNAVNVQLLFLEEQEKEMKTITEKKKKRKPDHSEADRKARETE